MLVPRRVVGTTEDCSTPANLAPSCPARMPASPASCAARFAAQDLTLGALTGPPQSAATTLPAAVPTCDPLTRLGLGIARCHALPA